MLTDAQTPFLGTPLVPLRIQALAAKPGPKTPAGRRISPCPARWQSCLCLARLYYNVLYYNYYNILYYNIAILSLPRESCRE